MRPRAGVARRVPPRNRVAIPTHFYKIIFKKKALGASDSIAILLPHDNAKHTGDAWNHSMNSISTFRLFPFSAVLLCLNTQP
jgi:DNA/RNA endonuclease G (NUC1)